MATQLSDMEETLSRVTRPASRDFMGEALRCYQAGAFRACVVLSAIALFDDLKSKVAELAKVNKTAKSINDEVSKKHSAQDVFETFLSDQLIKSQLVDAAQETQLKLIRELRNKAAHPSGVHASAEQARFVFFETIDKFLSKAELQTTHAADALLERIPLGNFFPSNSITEISAIVSAEIKTVHSEAIPYLLHKLVALCKGNENTAKLSAQYFVYGLAQLRQSRDLLRKALIVPESSNNQFMDTIISCVAIDAELLDELGPVERSRIGALLSAQIANPTQGQAPTHLNHPIFFVSAVIERFGQEKTLEWFPSQTASVLEKYRSDGSLLKAISSPGPIRDAYVDKFRTLAGSGTFAYANAAAQLLDQFDATIGKQLSPAAAFDLLIQITRAAEWGAFDSQALLNSHFSGAPNLRSAAQVFVDTNTAEATKQFQAAGLATSFDKWLG